MGEIKHFFEVYKALEGKKTVVKRFEGCLLYTSIARHMFDLDGRAKVSTVRTRFAQWGFAFAEDLIALRKSDIDGSGTCLLYTSRCV